MSTVRILRSFFWNRNCRRNFAKLSERDFWSRMGGSAYSFRSNDNLYIRNNSFKWQKIFCRLHAFNTFQTIGSFSAYLHWELVFFCRERMLLLILKRGKMIVHHTRLRKNGDLHLWETAALNVRASIMREIMRSKDVQCSNKKLR